MAKKYLTLEEAADLAGVSPAELRRLREAGDVRGFADRGTWKFKEEDIQELSRRRQADSDPDVPMLDDTGSSIIGAEDVGEQPTVIRGSALDDDSPLSGTSDSDVRLILDDTLSTGDSGKGSSLLKDSDSDVRLVEDSGPSLLEEGSDSDVKLVGTDADIPLLDEDEEGSDSDVRLVESGAKTEPAKKLDTGSKTKKPVRNASESDIQLAAGDSGLPLSLDDESGDDDSVLSDEPARGSGVALAAESGISLEGLADSGISLEHADSGIKLGGDSGIALAGLADSGISLADDDDDAAITLADSRSPTSRRAPATSGNAPTRKAKDDDDTALEVPTADDSEFELAMDDDQADTSVILFDDEESVDERSATVVKKGRKEKPVDDDFDVAAGTDDFDAVDSFEDDEAVVASDDLVGEDDELDFVEAGDEDFGDEFASGESHSDFAAPIGGRMAAPVEQDWGTGTFVGLLAATVLMAVCGVVMFDLVRYMWSWGDPNPLSSTLLTSLGDLF